jgi:hypothetical protein
MNDSDAFFTHTIVGAPFSVVLGRRMGQRETRAAGLQVHLDTGESRLGQLWQDWLVLNETTDQPGRPHPLPGRIRLWLERHALWLAAFGLVSMACSAVLWGVLAWR